MSIPKSIPWGRIKVDLEKTTGKLRPKQKSQVPKENTSSPWIILVFISWKWQSKSKPTLSFQGLSLPPDSLSLGIGREEDGQVFITLVMWWQVLSTLLSIRRETLLMKVDISAIRIDSPRQEPFHLAEVQESLPILSKTFLELKRYF